MKNKILEKIENHNLIKKYILCTISLIISAISYNLLVQPFHIVTGGTGGIAIIVEELTSISPSLTIFLLSAFFLIFGFIFLGIEEGTVALYITIVYPLLVNYTSNITNYIDVSDAPLLLISVFGGLISGISNGLIYKTGFNTGGTGILSQIIAKYKKVSIATVNFLISVTIVIAGGYIFGFNMILYAVVFLYFNRLISEKFLLGISRNKVFYIISDKHLEIKEFILKELNLNTTIFTTKGKYSNTKKKVIMAVIPTSMYFILKEAVKKIDENAFVIITDGYEVKARVLSNNKKSRILSKSMI